MSYQCLKPRLAIQENEGEKPIFLKITKEHDYEFWLRNVPKKYKLLLISCGTCENCLKKKSQEWTTRLLKELENHNFAYFVTLTYDDKNYQDLNKRDIQLFLKRYRKNFNLKLKYYVVGEYGETTKRAHYHGIFFQDKPIKDLTFYANNLYISKLFSDSWKNGHCLISKQVNERSIKYTIAYTLKKLGETKIVLMSKGLGLKYFDKNKEDLKEHDGVYVQNGFKQKLPSYFIRKLKESDDLSDLIYLKERKNQLRDSTLLSGSTLGDLSDLFIESKKSRVLKGKGEF